MQALDLDPTSFTPAIVIKYGELNLRPSSPDSFAIRLHPECWPLTNVQEDWVEDDDGVAFLKKKVKFGQGLLSQEESENEGSALMWDGEWTGHEVCLVVQ